MSVNGEYIARRLFEMQDLSYRDFHSRLMPGVPKEKIIGVRVPQLRKLTKELLIEGDYEPFLQELPHKYYEQDNVHILLISACGDFNEAVKLVSSFLPYIDNWATCDMLSPKAFAVKPATLAEYAEKWAGDKHVYTARFGISVFMKFFLGQHFKPEYADIVADVSNGDYYVKMMQAWYFATALAKNEKEILPYFENRRLEAWVHNKAIQKSIESYRITCELKEHLRKLRTK